MGSLALLKASWVGGSGAVCVDHSVVCCALTNACAFSLLVSGRFFERQLTSFSVPEELFGPLELRELENDRYVRKTERYGAQLQSMSCKSLSELRAIVICPTQMLLS